MESALPPFAYTTDNAAMIGIVGYFKYMEKEFASLEQSAIADYPFNMDLFYFPKLEETSTQIHFSKEESKHISRVLRKKQETHCGPPTERGLKLL